MRAVSALVFLSVALLLFMAYQAARQELAIRSYLVRISLAKEQVQVKENEIVAVKVKVQAANTQLTSLKSNEDDLKNQIQEAQKNKENFEKALKTCTTEKDNSEKIKTEITDTLNKMKEGQEAERKKAEEEVQNLKQQILDRDKAICVFLDPQFEEGKKLCAV